MSEPYDLERLVVALSWAFIFTVLPIVAGLILGGPWWVWALLSLGSALSVVSLFVVGHRVADEHERRRWEE